MVRTNVMATLEPVGWDPDGCAFPAQRLSGRLTGPCPRFHPTGKDRSNGCPQSGRMRTDQNNRSSPCQANQAGPPQMPAAA